MGVTIVAEVVFISVAMPRNWTLKPVEAVNSIQINKIPRVENNARIFFLGVLVAFSVSFGLEPVLLLDRQIDYSLTLQKGKS